MPVQKGDFVLLDYSMRVKETGELFDTTKEDEAREAKIRSQGAFYEPSLVVVGAGWVLKGFDEAIVGVEEGKPFTVEVPPERGLGPRDPNKIKLVPLRRFRGQDRRLQPGVQVEVNGQVAVVRAVGAGRVQLDFNPPLAGKTIVYEAVVRKVVSDPMDRIRHLIHRRLPSIPMEKFGLEVEGGGIKITVPEEAFLLEGLQIVKRGIAVDVERFFPEVKETVFVERYLRRAPPPQAEKKPEEKERTAVTTEAEKLEQGEKVEAKPESQA